jgi:hypothetical protein
MVGISCRAISEHGIGSSCEVNWLIDRLGGKALPSVDLAHVDLGGAFGKRITFVLRNASLTQDRSVGQAAAGGGSAARLSTTCAILAILTRALCAGCVAQRIRIRLPD